jgi:hypothetical protein
MRKLLVVAAAALALAGCGNAGGKPRSDAESSTAARTGTTASASTAALGRVDVTTCQIYVSAQTDVYDFLTRLETEGSVSGPDTTKARLDLLTVGTEAETFVDQVQSPALAGALRSVITHAKSVNEALLAQQPIDAAGLRSALASAAEACEDGGFVIPWYRGA